MKPLLRKQYIGVIITTIVFVVVIGGFVALFFLMKDRQQRVQEVKQTLATYEQNKKTFAKETTTLQHATTRVEALEQKRITEEKIPELLSEIEAVAIQKGVIVEVTTVQTPSVDGKKKLFIDISAQGEFDKLTLFTDTLLSREYQIHFDTLSVHREQTETGGVWQLLGTFEVISF